jgi:hypothetical protein
MEVIKQPLPSVYIQTRYTAGHFTTSISVPSPSHSCRFSVQDRLFGQSEELKVQPVIKLRLLISQLLVSFLLCKLNIFYEVNLSLTKPIFPIRLGMHMGNKLVKKLVNFVNTSSLHSCNKTYSLDAGLQTMNYRHLCLINMNKYVLLQC